MKTKKELIQIREESYHIPTPLNACRNCKHGWFYHGGKEGDCRAIHIRDKLVCKDISPDGFCELWESKK